MCRVNHVLCLNHKSLLFINLLKYEIFENNRLLSKMNVNNIVLFGPKSIATILLLNQQLQQMTIINDDNNKCKEEENI